MKLFKTWGMERRSVTKVFRALSKASSPYNLGFQLSISKKRNILNPTKQLWTYPHLHICTWLQKTKLSWVHHAWNQVETWKLRNSHKSHIAQLSASRSKWRFLLVWVGTSGPWQPGKEERCQLSNLTDATWTSRMRFPYEQIMLLASLKSYVECCMLRIWLWWYLKSRIPLGELTSNWSLWLRFCTSSANSFSMGVVT